MANLSRRLATVAPALLRRLSTEARAAAAPIQDDNLYRRLSKLRSPGMVTSTINEFIREGKTVSKLELERCINELRKYKRYRDALEIMEWMEFRKFNFKHSNYAIRVDLVAKVRGIAAAEEYLNSLSPNARVHCVYGALLNCYCMEKMTDKALDLFAKMVKDNMISRPLPFNNLMSMYIALGQPQKALILGEEMKKTNIQPDTCTYNLLMNSYAHLNDIQGVERVFKELKLENGKECNWTTYANLASIYSKARYQEKAKLALQNAEKEMDSHDREAYHFLISLYAGVSDLDQVHRLWKSLKSNMAKVTNRSYLLMLQALGNLNDIKGMTECYEEWLSVCSDNYDVKLPTVVIRAYLRHDMVEEAESVYETAISRSTVPLFYAWEQFMIYYLRKNQIKRALEMVEMACQALEGKWEPKSQTLEKFLDCFNPESDVNSAEEFYGFMKRINCVDGRVYKLLLKTYEAAGETMPDMRARMEEDGVEVSAELEDLLAIVCPE